MTSRGGRICFGSSATSCEQRTLRFEGLLRPRLGDAQKLLLHFVKPRRDAVVPFWME